MKIWKLEIEFRNKVPTAMYFQNKPSVEDLVPIINNLDIEVDEFSDLKLDSTKTATKLVEKLSETVFDWQDSYVEFILTECNLIAN